MTVVVKSSSEDIISLPARLMTLLDLQDGDEIKTIVEGQTLRVTSLDHFLALRGTLDDDEAFDSAIKFLDQAWQSWTTPNSV
jgi:antitoxin component of MazEF toxin-antitoxin module